MEPEIKVTKINKRWHARLSLGDSIFDEMACSNMQDIGYICREMLRWFAKCGGKSPFADAARKRQHVKTFGKIWWRKHLDEERGR